MYAATPGTVATPATTPTTIPAIAPPDRDAEAVGAAVGLGVEVAGINDRGSKPQVVAAGDAALKEEYVSLSAWLLML